MLDVVIDLVGAGGPEAALGGVGIDDDDGFRIFDGGVGADETDRPFGADFGRVDQFDFVDVEDGLRGALRAWLR